MGAFAPDAALHTKPRLMPTIPDSMRSATASALARLRVWTKDTSPNTVSLASATASSTDSKLAIGATGPKISSWNARASVGRPAITVGS